MEKYIGNKKAILEDIEQFMINKGIKSGVFCDIFTGTTNVAQFFKQRNFSIISNDINRCCYPLQISYISNNSFPKYSKLLKMIKDKGFKYNKDEIDNMKNHVAKKIKNDKVFLDGYLDKLDFLRNILRDL